MEGDIAEERTILIVANEFHDVFRDQVLGIPDVLRTMLTIVPPTDRAASTAIAPRKVVSAATIINPGFVEAVLVYAETTFVVSVRSLLPCLLVSLLELRRCGIGPVVPFAEHACAITMRLKGRGDRGFLFRQLTASLWACPYPIRMATRQ